MLNELIYWRDVPIDVEWGAFEYIANNWRNKIIVVCMKDFEDERRKCNWQNNNLNNIETIIVDKINNKEKELMNIIDKYPNAIHMFAGLRGEKQKYLKYCIKNNKKIVIIAERPFLYGNKIKIAAKKFAFFMMYSYYNAIWSKNINCFLPMGSIGVKTYNKYGWSKKKLFPFMYNPKLPLIKIKDRVVDIPKFLYIGRFDKNSKGVDILMKSIDLLDDDKNWKVDLVGGYGDITDEVIEWCKNKKNVEFVGTWDSDTVCYKMANYDVCIVPSKYDGWNLTPNQAINCGIGTIITDEAGSDELIRESNSGIVVKANDVGDLTNAINYVIENPNIIKKWRNKAIQYSKKISSEVVGQYFIDIMDYTFNNEQNKRPACPWLNNKE